MLPFLYSTLKTNTIYMGQYYTNDVNTTQQIKTVLTIVGLSMVMIAAFGVSTVQAKEINSSDFKYSIHVTDIIPYYTYGGISKVVSNGHDSLEDQDVVRLVIQDSNYYAVYNNNYDNTFVFAGIYENGA